MKTHLTFLFCLVLYLCFPNHVADAQEISVTGKVVNSNQTPLSNVRVSLQNNPEVTCYTDQEGEFLLNNSATEVIPVSSIKEYVKLRPDGFLEICFVNKQVSVIIVDLLGKIQSTITSKETIHGIYQVNPYPYLNDMAKGIYILSVYTGSDVYSFKIHNHSSNYVAEGQPEISAYNNKNGALTKSVYSEEDTIVLQHAYYKTTKIKVYDLDADVGTITIDNFGDYSPADNIDADSAKFIRGYGNFLEITGNESLNFLIQFDALSPIDDDLTVKAIPVQGFNYLELEENFVSGIHFEPEGVQFAIPVEVFVDLKDVPISDSLVVFHYDYQKQQMEYLPYNSFETNSGDMIRFVVSHFSDIGIGYESALPEGLDLDDETRAMETRLYWTNRMWEGGNVEELHVHLKLILRDYYVNELGPSIEEVRDFQSFKKALGQFQLVIHYSNLYLIDITTLDFYDEAVMNINKKVEYLAGIINDGCQSITDKCLQREVLKIAIDLSNITNIFPFINALPLENLCPEIIMDFVHQLEMHQSFFMLPVNGSANTECTAYNTSLNEVPITFDLSSENPEIAEVDQNGTITGLKEGRTRIIAKYCELEAYVLIAVTDEETTFCTMEPPIDDNTYTIKNSFKLYYILINDIPADADLNYNITSIVNLKTGRAELRENVNGIVYLMGGSVNYNQNSLRTDDLSCNESGYYDTLLGDDSVLRIYPGGHSTRIIENEKKSSPPVIGEGYLPREDD